MINWCRNNNWCWCYDVSMGHDWCWCDDWRCFHNWCWCYDCSYRSRCYGYVSDWFVRSGNKNWFRWKLYYESLRK